MNGSLPRKINKYWALDTLKMKKNEQAGSVISQLLDEDHFFILSNQKPHHENMVAMITSLERSGLVDSEFKQRIMKREQIKNTLFDRGIAFPHAMNQASHQIVLAVGIYPLKQKVCEEEVRIVFLLGIPESQHNETLLIQLYEEMIALSKKDRFALQRFKCTDLYRDKKARATTMHHSERIKEVNVFVFLCVNDLHWRRLSPSDLSWLFSNQTFLQCVCRNAPKRKSSDWSQERPFQGGNACLSQC